MLLLAAIGLAITFGVMGVINMAHGEMVMLGAYTTFVVQEMIRTSTPALFDCSLAIAIPLAFLVAGARRHPDRARRHPLALWPAAGDAARHLGRQPDPAAGGPHAFSAPTTARSATPSFMTGSFDLAGLAITWNRLWIIVFALAGLRRAALRAARTRLRPADASRNPEPSHGLGDGHPDERVDALTFGLGSGIAGLAGVALSQIDNVSPNLGQSYIIDCSWSWCSAASAISGARWSARLTLGIANKLLEPYAGAVLGKILLLVLIILFIQKRPRGLFALKGRAVEA